MLITPDVLILAKALLEEFNSYGIIELYFVRTEYQLADIFTKALPKDRFKYLVRRIGMSCLTPAELEVKDSQEKDKIESKPDKNGKRVEAGKSLKQLQWIKEEKPKKTQKEWSKTHTRSKSYSNFKKNEENKRAIFASNPKYNHRGQFCQRSQVVTARTIHAIRGERNPRKGQNRIKTRQKREACQSREKFKAVAVDKGRKTEENAKRMVKNAYTVKKLFKL
nr:retrovirus-related Pol polyprotein from transposon TNT 1-94 [Tanacetum cinerariifolium]